MWKAKTKNYFKTSNNHKLSYNIMDSILLQSKIVVLFLFLIYQNNYYRDKREILISLA